MSPLLVSHLRRISWLLAFGNLISLQGLGAEIISLSPGAGAEWDLKWRSEAGMRFGLQSAGSVSGPWADLGEALSLGGEQTWKIPREMGGSQRFFRLIFHRGENPFEWDEATRGGVVQADQFPGQWGVSYRDSREVAVGAVEFASLQVNQGILVTTGSVLFQGNSWRYEASPTDRLRIQFADGARADYIIQAIEGDFSSTASNFISRNHRLEWRVVMENGTDVDFLSVQTGAINRGKIKGTLVQQEGTFQVDLDGVADEYFESSFGGSETRSTTQVTGTVSTAAWNLTLDQTFRFELVVSDGQSASTSSSVIQQQMHWGNQVFAWNDVRRQRAFRNGRPNEVDSYWQGSGSVFLDGKELGKVKKVARGDEVLFVLSSASEEVVLERWR